VLCPVIFEGGEKEGRMRRPSSVSFQLPCCEGGKKRGNFAPPGDSSRQSFDHTK